MSTLKYIIDRFKVEVGDQFPVRLPGVCRRDISRWLKDLDFKIGVEVGVAQGQFLQILCKNNPQMKFYGVDPYVPYKGYTDYTLEKTYIALREGLKKYMRGLTNYEIIEEYSMDAVKRFKDNSLDFVYIDANHADPWVTEDIIEWTKKVRPGGIVSGHDYISLEMDGFPLKYDVKAAIQKYVKDNNINPWFVLGADEKDPIVRRDDSRSWMFIKPEI
jgi:hypothetical protein